MNYAEAMSAVLDGKKVRFAVWGENEYAALDELGDAVLIYPSRANMIVVRSEMQSDGWEIWEEKKKVTLRQLLETAQVVKKESGVLSHEEVIKKIWERLS